MRSSSRIALGGSLVAMATTGALAVGFFSKDRAISALAGGATLASALAVAATGWSLRARPSADREDEVSPPPPETEAASEATGGPLSNRPWTKLVEECVDLFDELDRLHGQLDGARREMAEHVSEKLKDMLLRSGVEMIADEHAFDRHRHEAVGGATSIVSGAVVGETLSPGFAVSPRVFRRARVRLAENASVEAGGQR